MLPFERQLKQEEKKKKKAKTHKLRVTCSSLSDDILTPGGYNWSLHCVDHLSSGG